MAAVVGSLEPATSVCSALTTTYVRDARVKAFMLSTAWSATSSLCLIPGQDGSVGHGALGKVDRVEHILSLVDMDRPPLVASNQLRYKRDITDRMADTNIFYCLK